MFLYNSYAILELHNLLYLWFILLCIAANKVIIFWYLYRIAVESSLCPDGRVRGD